MHLQRFFIFPFCLFSLTCCENGSNKDTYQKMNGDSVSAESVDVSDAIQENDTLVADNVNDNFRLYGESLYTGPYLVDSHLSPVCIDNDTLLLFQDTLDGCYFKLEFHKKGLGAPVIQSVEKDFVEFLSGDVGHDLSVAYGKKSKAWREEILSAESKCDVEYSVRMDEVGDKRVNCIFYGFFQYANSHANSYETCVTYDKRSGRPFDMGMIRMDDTLRHMIEDSDELSGETIHSKIQPCLLGDSVVFLLPDWRPTNWENDLPKKILPLGKLLPYLMEEGRNFVER